MRNSNSTHGKSDSMFAALSPEVQMTIFKQLLARGAAAVGNAELSAFAESEALPIQIRLASESLLSARMALEESDEEADYGTLALAIVECERALSALMAPPAPADKTAPARTAKAGETQFGHRIGSLGALYDEYVARQTPGATVSARLMYEALRRESERSFTLTHVRNHLAQLHREHWRGCQLTKLSAHVYRYDGAK